MTSSKKLSQVKQNITEGIRLSIKRKLQIVSYLAKAFQPSHLVAIQAKFDYFAGSQNICGKIRLRWYKPGTRGLYKAAIGTN